MSKQLRIKNEGLRMCLGIIVIALLLIGGVAAVNTYDMDNVERINIADRANAPRVVEFDGCNYIRFVHTHEYIHQANCPNPDHKTEGK